MNARKINRTYALITAFVVWFALGLQLRLSVKQFGGDTWSALKLYLSYFTILTNILVASCLTIICFSTLSKVGRLFHKASTQTAIAVYILVVGLIYNVALRGLTHPIGLYRVADELLHVVNPLLFIVFWVFFVSKVKLEYKDALRWLIYPVLYVLFIIVRGAIISQYPYPFINVVDLGYPKALLNTGVILFVFWLLSLLFIFVGKKTSNS